MLDDPSTGLLSQKSNNVFKSLQNKLTMMMLVKALQVSFSTCLKLNVMWIEINETVNFEATEDKMF